MIVYNKYINSRDYTWYDSSNIVYSECIDTTETEKTLKIVFKQGRAYLYRKVDVNDYLLFRNAESNGKAFNQYIKKYECVRMPDVDLSDLEKKKEEFQEEHRKIDEAMTNLSYHLDFNPETKEFRLKLNDNVIYEGVEDHVNIMRLLKSMSITYSFSEMEDNLEEPDIKE